MSDVRGEVVVDSGTGALDGVVMDPIGSAPVAGVVVDLDGSDQSVTDSEGRFSFPGLPAGNYGLSIPNLALKEVGLCNALSGHWKEGTGQ